MKESLTSSDTCSTCSTILFYTFSIIYLVEIFPHLYTVIQNPKILILGIISSNVPTESSSAFIFGFFVIYFAYEKKSFLFFLSSFLFLLAFKRIAIMGCTLVFLISIFNYI